MPVKACDRMNVDEAEKHNPKPTTVFIGSGKTIKPVDAEAQRQAACSHRFAGEEAGYVPYAHARWCLDCHCWIW
jgi:hypothetical protein